MEVAKDLFKDVKYYLVGNIDQKVEDALLAGGAKRDHYLSEMCSHAIADDPSEADCSEARELFELPVVTSRWVLLSTKCGVLLPTEGFSPEESRIFSGVLACASSLNEHDKRHAWATLTFNGGLCQNTLNQNVTHLITGKAAGAKYECALRHSDRVKVVTPDWLTECVAAGVLLDESRFHPRLLLYEQLAPPTRQQSSPEAMDVPVSAAPRTATLIRNPATDPAAGVASGTPNRPGAANAPPPKTPTYNYHPHSPKTNSRTKEALARMVSGRLGGQTSPPTTDRGMLRPNTPGAPTGMRSPRGMLRNITNSGEPRMPRSPRGSPRGPRGPRSPRGSPRGRAAKINQLMGGLGRGEGRGGRLFGSNMHHPGGSHPLLPHQAPPQPSLSVYFGHDPIETIPPDACLLGCVFYMTDYQKYLDSETTNMWKKVIAAHGGQVDESYSNRVTHVLCEHQRSDVYQLALRDGKRLVTAHWLNDTLLRKKLMPPWLALHFPLMWSHKEKPCTNQIICATNFEGEERMRLKQMIASLGAKYTGYMSHANSVVIARKPEGIKYQKAMEWRIPVVNVAWLNDLLLGDLTPLKLPVTPRFLQFVDEPFKLDLWRVAHLLEGWKQPIRISKESWKRFQASPRLSTPSLPVVGVQGSEASNGSVKRKAEDTADISEPAKKARTDENSAPAGEGPVVLLTGLPKSKALQLAKEVERMGGSMTSVATGATHLVAKAVARTVKFLTGLSVVKHVLSPEWIEASAKQGQFIEEDAFQLQDAKAEAEFCFSFVKSLEKARVKKVFEGFTFYITPGVTPGKGTLGDIIKNAGGKLVEKQPRVTAIRNMVNTQGEPTFVTVSCDNDLFLCQNLISRNIGVHNAEFILTGVMKQEVNFEAYRLA